MLVGKILILSMVFAGFAHAMDWKVDTTNAKINFTIKGIFGKVHSHFSGLKARIHFDEGDLAASTMSASVDAKTISTGIDLRNSDLRKKEEWFNVEKYPTVSFKSEKFEKTKNGYQVTGYLTIKGISKSVVIPFTFDDKHSAGIFNGKFSIQRKDFNLGKPGGSVGSIITVELSVPATS